MPKALVLTGFDVDGWEGDCPFVRTWEAGVCVVNFVGGDGGERGDVETGDGGSAFVELLRVLQGVVGLLLGGDGGEGSSIVVGDTEDVVDLAEDAADSTEKGCAGNTEGLVTG